MKVFAESFFWKKIPTAGLKERFYSSAACDTISSGGHATAETAKKEAIMIFTTTHSVQGKTIANYHGVVVGEAVLGVNVFKDMFAGIRDLVGGRSHTYERELERARAAALENLEASAKELGAEAVVGIDLDYQVLGAGGSGMFMVSISDTAVSF